MSFWIGFGLGLLAGFIVAISAVIFVWICFGDNAD
jgi:hypothetical protein